MHKHALQDGQEHNLLGVFCHNKGGGTTKLKNYAGCPICQKVFFVELKQIGGD